MIANKNDTELFINFNYFQVHAQHKQKIKSSYI